MSLPILSQNELCSVQKPAQYIGGELGSVVKDPAKVDMRICLAFPDTYEVGMSHVGYQILYELINRDERMWAERAYVPLPDMEQLLRSKKRPLSSLESTTPLADFDVVGFSLQYELCMSGILGILELGQLPLLAAERGDGCPLVIGGGPVSYHPEPFADFFDAFLVGDGEELVPEFLQKLTELNKGELSRRDKLTELAKIQGVYVPSLFDSEIDAEGKLHITPQLEDYPSVKRRVLSTLEGAPFPRKPIVPNIEAVHDRLSVEVMRGCVRGCRFCQAGYLYRPQRERSPEEIREIIRESLGNTGYEEVSLLSLSTADYCSILPLLKILKDDLAEEDQLAISFPSTRVDALKPELLREVQPIRRTGFTMAPEGGTQRIRDVINKGVSDQQIEDTITNVFKLGWSSVKLYFMIGLPTETDEDVAGIVEIAKLAKRISGSGKKITISVSTHVPKPHTPFQWAEQISVAETKRKQQFLARELRALKVNFRYHDAESSFLEGVFARADRSLSKVIIRAYELGTRLDGWVEKLNFETWMQAFEECGVEPSYYLREREVDEALPWDHISCDITKRYFAKEWTRSAAVRTTPNCLTETCSTCGACNYDDTRNVLFSRGNSQSRLGIVNPPWEQNIDDSEIIELGVKKARENLDQIKNNKSYSLKEYLKTESDEGGEYEEAKESNFRVRLQYSKQGRARFRSHLELKSVFFRAARRAELPISFSKGFNPKPKFAFGPPLQLGIGSSIEFVDFYLYEDMPAEELLTKLNETLPEGFRIEKAWAVEMKEPSIQSYVISHSYHATLEGSDQEAMQAIADKAADLESLEIQRRNKKGKIVRFPLAEYLSDIKLSDSCASFTLKVDELGRTIKPSELSKELFALDISSIDIHKTGTAFRS